MTNKDKFLKDGVSYIELARQLSDYIYNESPVKKCVFPDEIGSFFEQEIMPTLTDDERVILRNIANEYELICREKGNNLKIIARGNGYTEFYEYNHLFQFIKENEEYSIEELLKGE